MIYYESEFRRGDPVPENCVHQGKRAVERYETKPASAYSWFFPVWFQTTARIYL